MGWLCLDYGQAGQVRTDKKDLTAGTDRPDTPIQGVSMCPDLVYIFPTRNKKT